MDAEWFHVDGQTGITELLAAFRNFVNVPKELYILRVYYNCILCDLRTAIISLYRIN
jgi:hypothetical protein